MTLAAQHPNIMIGIVTAIGVLSIVAIVCSGLIAWFFLTESRQEDRP